MSSFEETVREVSEWFAGPRFTGIIRLYSPRQVVEQRGTIAADYPVARAAAGAFYTRLRELFQAGKSITTFGPYSPGQAVTIKRLGIEGIYLGGWATSAKGSVTEDPGADLASYPLSQVPDEAASIVRALLTADKNQLFFRSRMKPEQRAATPEVDYRPFIIADADTGHGGDAHVRNLIRRFVEVGVPGYHIEDQKPGVKKCGHQGGKVLVSENDQIQRLNAARFQLDIMRVPGIIVARTDAEAADLLEGCADERDQPFILGVTNLEVPSYKAVFLTLQRKFHEAGVDELRGHMMFAMSDSEYAAATAWLETTGLLPLIEENAKAYKKSSDGLVDGMLDKVIPRFLDAWQEAADLMTYRQAVADVMEFRVSEGESFDLSVDEWLAFSKRASWYAAREKARSMEIDVTWDCERAKTPEGYYQVQGGLDYAIVKSLAAAPFADILWMETATANLAEAKAFADAIHAEFPDMMLAYNLSPSFSWDTTGMSDEQMKHFPEELGKLGFVFNFITYGGHQIDGLAAEDFATALRQDGMLSLARLQRKFRLLESPYRTPQTLVGGPRLDAALVASSGRTATTKAMGKGSTQHQHLVQTEFPPKVLEDWLQIWAEHNGLPPVFRAQLRPVAAGSDFLELSLWNDSTDRVGNIIFADVQDRHGHKLLSVRDMNTFDPSLRKKRLMTLAHLFLLHRYKAGLVHYLSPTEDNQHQALKMQRLGIFGNVNNEAGLIIVASVDAVRIAELLNPDRVVLRKLIAKEG
ncbi:MAG TPA: isocitrate lyase ICL2 [Candidatus Limnocylindrales bacterium]|jgi:isocitrate lyase|nr:isocitrate lyase ICL2 [Candidatus Limnocylindrales bacterium]